jgi:hypothetical protein
VIFFSLVVNRFVELLGDVKPIDRRLGIRQQLPTGMVKRDRHVRAVGPHE